ncbi:MAG: hypothetical protein FJ253_06585 [Phycisphaerae bacterium]|nr:hypothetical protein [Phycisphaerae bacterium]
MWIGRACHPPARALVRGLRGVVNGRRPVPDPALLERSILVDAETPQERAWAIEQAARCPGVFLVVGDGAGFDSALSRRVQLAAQGCSLVLVSRLDRERSALSVAMTRWLVLPQSCGAGEAGRVAAWIDGASPGSAPPVEWPPPARWRVILLRSKQASAASTAQDHGPVGADSKSPPGPIGTATKRGQ